MDGFSNLKAQSVLSELLEAYKNELQKSIQLISSIDEDKQQEIINKVYISGPGSHIKNLKTNLAQIFKCGVESLAEINDDFLKKSKIQKSNYLFNRNKEKVFKRRDNSNNSLKAIKNSIQKKKIEIEAIKSPESVKYKLARLEIEKTTKIKSIDQATEKLVQTAKDFKELKLNFSSQHKNYNDELSLVSKDLEEKGASLLNNYKIQDQLKERISEIEYEYDKGSGKNKKLIKGYKNQYQAKIKSATNTRLKLLEEKEEFESKIDSLEQQVIKKQDEIQGNNLKLDHGQSEYATFEYLKESIHRTSNAFKKSFIDRVRVLENISNKDLNSLNEADYSIVQNTKRVNEIKESFNASINGELDQTQFIDKDQGDNTKKKFNENLNYDFRSAIRCFRIKNFFSTVIKINQDQKELTEKKETAKNRTKKLIINQKELKKFLELVTNELKSIEKELKQKENKRVGLKELLTFVRESIQMLNEIDHNNELADELRKQIKLTDKEIKDLEKDIEELKDKVENREDENNRIKIEIERAKKIIDHDSNQKENDLKKLESDNNNLSEKIEEQIYFIKQAKKEISDSENYCVQLEKSILYKKKDLEDLNDEKIFISEKYSNEERAISKKFEKQIRIINQNKNQKIKESEKLKTAQ